MKNIAITALIACLLNEASAGQYSISVSTNTIAPGQSLIVSWTAPNGTPSDDWIGIYPADKDPSAYVGFAYTDGAVSGRQTFELEILGKYRIQYFQHNTTVAMTPAVDVTVSPLNEIYNFKVTPQSVAPGEPVEVSWNIPTSVNIGSDFIGLMRQGQTNLLQQALVQGVYNGQAYFRVYDQGYYAIQYYKHGHLEPATALVLFYVVPRLNIAAEGGSIIVSWPSTTDFNYRLFGLSGTNTAWQLISDFAGTGDAISYRQNALDPIELFQLKLRPR